MLDAKDEGAHNRRQRGTNEGPQGRPIRLCRTIFLQTGWSAASHHIWKRMPCRRRADAFVGRCPLLRELLRDGGIHPSRPQRVARDLEGVRPGGIQLKLGENADEGGLPLQGGESRFEWVFIARTVA